MGGAFGSCFLTRNNEGIGMMMLKGILKITDTLPMIVFLWQVAYLLGHLQGLRSSVLAEVSLALNNYSWPLNNTRLMYTQKSNYHYRQSFAAADSQLQTENTAGPLIYRCCSRVSRPMKLCLPIITICWFWFSSTHKISQFP